MVLKLDSNFGEKANDKKKFCIVSNLNLLKICNLHFKQLPICITIYKMHKT
jgi:hypothetical protein